MMGDVAEGVGKKDEDAVQIRELTFKSAFGLEFLAQQLVQKICQEFFTFNVLCVGDTGIGKTTLAGALFGISDLPKTPAIHSHQKVSLASHTRDLVEGGVRIRLTITETVGFGDQLNREDDCQPIVEYVNSKFENYLQEELKIRRRLASYNDTRVHACLYLMNPTGHCMRASDLLFLKSLHEKVNLIPIIARADALTPLEVSRCKRAVLDELERQEVRVYRFPADEDDCGDGASDSEDNVPFAIVASQDPGRVREYPWGAVYAEDLAHSDLAKLRQLLVHSHMDDLHERTHTHFYEKYRRGRMAEMGFGSGGDGDEVPMTEFLQKRREAMRVDLEGQEAEMKSQFTLRAELTEAELTAQAASNARLELEISQMQAEDGAVQRELKALQEEAERWRHSRCSGQGELAKQ